MYTVRQRIRIKENVLWNLLGALRAVQSQQFWGSRSSCQNTGSLDAQQLPYTYRKEAIN